MFDRIASLYYFKTAEKFTIKKMTREFVVVVRVGTQVKSVLVIVYANFLNYLLNILKIYNIIVCKFF